MMRYLFVGGPKNGEKIELNEACPYLTVPVHRAEVAKIPSCYNVLSEDHTWHTVTYRRNFFGITDYGFIFYSLDGMPPILVYEFLLDILHIQSKENSYKPTYSEEADVPWIKQNDNAT